MKRLQRLKFSVCLLSWLYLLLLTGCTDNPLDVAGNGSGTNTGNSITAAYRFENGDAAAYAQVSIRPENYVKNSSADSGQGIYDFTTDRKGEFTITKIPVGNYKIEVYDNNNRAVLQNISIKSDTTAYVLDEATLATVGKVSGKINLPDRDIQIHVQLVGTIHSSSVDPVTESFELNNIPGGMYALTAFAPNEETLEPQLRDVVVKSEEESVIEGLNMEDYDRWSYSRLLTIDPQEELSFNGNETSFPLLISLDESNFNFSEANFDGSDFRVVDSGGELLDYHIENWDSNNAKASIWVLLSSAPRKSVPQVYNVYWGNTLARDKSNSGVVFSNDDYQAVWHFHEAAMDSLKDVSSMSNTGLLQNVSEGDLDVTGISGKGYRLNGTSQYMGSKNLQWDPNTFTISIWFKTTTSEGGRLLGFSNPQFLSEPHKNGERQIWMSDEGTLHFGIFNDSITFEEWYLLEQDSILFKDNEFDDSHRQIISGSRVVNDGEWHLATATLGADGMKLYVDGFLEAENPDFTYGAARAGYWVVGAGVLGGWEPNPSSIFINGVLDEVRVEYTVHSMDYIRLMYLNSVSPDFLLKWE